MRSTLTISLPAELRQTLARTAKARGTTESEFVRQAVQTKLWEEAFEESRRQLQPSSRALGLLTDEDVFRVIS